MFPTRDMKKDTIQVTQFFSLFSIFKFLGSNCKTAITPSFQA
jgi:hypothetical protein